MSIIEELELNLPRIEVPTPNLFYYFLEGAKKGIAYAQWKLANCYYSGRFVPQSFSEARRWYGKAASQGFYLGERDFAFMLKAGLGGGVDLTGAAFHFERASEACGRAAIEAAQAFLLGSGVPQQRFKARDLFAKAAENGEKLGHEMVAVLDAMDSLPLVSSSERHEILRQSHRSGNLNATFALGMFFYMGGYTSNSKQLAYEYFHEAAGRGHIAASVYLAKCELGGIGCERDASSAMDRLDTLINLHHSPEAFYMKGASYMLGEDMPQDFEAALYWLEPAVEAGHPAACHAKAICLNAVYPTSEELVVRLSELFGKAFKAGFGKGLAELSGLLKVSESLFNLSQPFYYQCVLAAASRGCADSMISLGKYHLLGEHERDPVKGVFWTAAAIDESHPEAPGVLAHFIEKESEHVITVRTLHLLGASYGSVHSAVWLAHHFNNLPGVDRGLVARYYLLAARQGDIAALGVLAAMFRTGDGVPRNDAIADMFDELYLEKMYQSDDSAVVSSSNFGQEDPSQKTCRGALVIAFPAPQQLTNSKSPPSIEQSNDLDNEGESLARNHGNNALESNCDDIPSVDWAEASVASIETAYSSLSHISKSS